MLSACAGLKHTPERGTLACLSAAMRRSLAAFKRQELASSLEAFKAFNYHPGNELLKVPSPLGKRSIVTPKHEGIVSTLWTAVFLPLSFEHSCLALALSWCRQQPLSTLLCWSITSLLCLCRLQCTRAHGFCVWVCIGHCKAGWADAVASSAAAGEQGGGQQRGGHRRQLPRSFPAGRHPGSRRGRGRALPCAPGQQRHTRCYHSQRSTCCSKCHFEDCKVKNELEYSLPVWAW